MGAQISVPSVRGDRVLWMCGGHTTQRAPEGVSRTVRTLGEIEPCRLDIKAAAPIRKFHGLKELMNAVDKFVFELKDHCPSLSGVFERTDAMLTIYPGNGSRFANHIDNTTGDGRVLTFIVYLNTEWDPSRGGALRVTVPSGHVWSHKDAAAAVSAAGDETQTDAKTRLPSQGESSKDINDIDDDDRSLLPSHSSAGAEDALTVTVLPPAAAATPETARTALDVYPNAGRAVLFFSSEIPHEVLPVLSERYAITFWYYDATERQRAVDEAKKGGRSEKASRSTADAQKEAKSFIEVLMGSDQEKTGSSQPHSAPPSDSELALLRERVQMLSEEAADIVASITGAPSVESFRTGFELLTVTDIQAMRLLFQKMGLK